MSLFEDNAIFTRIIVLDTLHPYLSTVKMSLLRSFLLWHYQPIASLLCVLFNTERKKEAAFTLAWRGSLPGSAERPQHHIRTKHDKRSCPPLSGRLSVSCRQQSVCPSLCPSSQLWKGALGLCTECIAQCRSLYFTPQVWFPLRSL